MSPSVVQSRCLSGVMALLLLGACSAPDPIPAADPLTTAQQPGAAAEGAVPSPTRSPVESPAESIVRPRLPVVEPSTSLCDEPAFSPRTVEPHLEPEQRRVLVRRLAEGYPAELRATADASRVVLWVCLDEEGRVQNTRVVESSGREAFDRLAEQALHAVRFTPAMERGDRVPAWVQIPVLYP